MAENWAQMMLQNHGATPSFSVTGGGIVILLCCNDLCLAKGPYEKLKLTVYKWRLMDCRVFQEMHSYTFTTSSLTSRPVPFWPLPSPLARIDDGMSQWGDRRHVTCLILNSGEVVKKLLTRTMTRHCWLAIGAVMQLSFAHTCTSSYSSSLYTYKVPILIFTVLPNRGVLITGRQAWAHPKIKKHLFQTDQFFLNISLS